MEPQELNETEPDVAVREESALDTQTQTNYLVWKKNTPFLYDYVSTYALLWPSMTVQFFPDLEKPSKLLNDASEHEILYQRLLLGTFTSGQATDSISILQLPYYENLNRQLNIDKLNYNSDKLEFEMTTVSKKKLSVLQKINHLGDVNKLVYMPQNPDVLVSGNNYGALVVYDRTKHSSYKNSGDSDDIHRPELTLSTEVLDHGEEIFAIDWNKQKEGTIVSGKMNGRVFLHDIQAGFTSKDQTSIQSICSFSDTTDGINDIQWIPDHDSLFTSVDEAGTFKLYDTRSKTVSLSAKISDDPLNTISINHANLMFSVVGDSAGNIQVRDIRSTQPDQSISVIRQAHEDAVTRVKWHPRFHNVFGSSSSDKTVKLFDASKDDKLVFIHSGHMLGVNDFDWSLHEDWMIGSVADDNSLHVWKPASDIVAGY